MTSIAQAKSPPLAVLLTSLLTCFAVPSSGSAAEPLLSTRSYNAFTQIFGRPEFFAGSALKAGTTSARMTFDLVSFSEIDVSDAEALQLDGETYHLVFNVDHAITPRWELGARVPVLHHSGGFMDSTVDAWHDLFGLPEGDRPNQGQDELDFFYRAGVAAPFRIDDSTSGIGDVQLRTRLLLTAPDPAARQLAVHAGVKLPTGDASDLTGSGATDYSVGIGYSDPLTLAGLRMTLSAHAGVMLLGTGDALENIVDGIQENTVPFAGLQLGIAATRNLTLIAQIQGAGAYYDSNLDTLDDTTILLNFGANLNYPKSGWHWQLGIIEDGLSNVSPDFALHFEIGKIIGRR